MSNSNYENLHYYAGATSQYEEPLPAVRSQRSKQIRWGFMGLGALALAGGAFLTGTCLHEQYLNNRQVLQVQLMAEEIATYHPQIEAEITQAGQFAAKIGNQVADDGALDQYNNVRTTAQAILDAQAPWPVIGTRPHDVQNQREIAEGLLAANTAVVSNFEEAETALTKSHEAWVLEQSKIPARAAADALTQPMATAQAVFDATDGLVSDAERAELQNIIAYAQGASAHAYRESTDANEYRTAQSECENALTSLTQQAERVYNLIPLAPQTILDEEGNEVPNPEFVPRPYISGLSVEGAEGEDSAAAEAPAATEAPVEAPIRG